MENDVLKIKEQLKPLDFSGDGRYPVLLVDYFEFYGFDFAGNGLEHIFGTFESNGQPLAAHIFRPKEYKATVFVLHGYLNHCGQLRHLIRFLIEAGYAVAAFDMLGHGLSGGQRGAIEDFSQYSRALADFVNVVDEHLDGPYHIIGFSTGGSAAMDYLFTHKDNVFDTVILAAPLVRYCGWQQTKTGFRLCKPFADSVPRMHRENSSDKEFLEFNRSRDFLHLQTVPLKWVEALHNWNDRIADLSACEAKVKVIQGTSDATVDWKFNIEFIREKFTHAQITIIEGARHELFNESADIRKQVFSKISSYLAEK
jgi:alpha-beta hydrolase superfamily lysophospholipase